MAAPVTLRNIRDAFVNQVKPTRNYSTVSRIRMSAASGASKRGFAFFGKPYPLGATITPSYFRVWNAETWTGSVTMTVERITESWAASRVNWNRQPAVGGTAVSVTKSNAPKDTMWEFNITSILQFVANGGAWYGLRITVNGTTVRTLYSAQAEESDMRPQVAIGWSDAPEPPESLSPSGNRAVSVAKPMLSYQFTDLGGDVTLSAHQVQINSTDDFTTPAWDSGWQNTSVPEMDLAAMTSPVYPGLSDLQSVYWRVRVRDGAGMESSWSDEVQMRRVAKVALTSPALGTATLTNSARNPSFETNTTLYGLTNLTLTQDSTWFEYGTKSAIVAVVTGGSSCVITPHGPLASPNSNRHAAVTGDKVSVRYRIKPLRNQGVRVNIVQYDAAGTSLGTLNGTTSQIISGVETTVERMNVTLTAANTVAFAVQLVFYEPNTTSTVPATAGNIGHIDGVAIINSGTANISESNVPYWDGSSGETSAFVYAWTGTAHLSTSTRQFYYVEDTSPPISWTLAAGRTQTAYRVWIYEAANPDNITFDSTKVTSTDSNIDTGNKSLPWPNRIYTLRIRVWDDIARERSGDDTPFYEYKRDFVYFAGVTITPPTNLVATAASPMPWVDLTFDRSTPPDFFTILRDGEVVENNLEAADLYTGGTSYAYRDKLASPRQSHDWQVIANQNGKDSQPTAVSTAVPLPLGTFVMNPDGSSPITVLKSATRPAPVVDVTQRTAQEVHQPVGGESPVLITQYISGYDGKVEGVLSDGIIEGLSAREMKNRLKAWKRTPGVVVHLFMVDEVLRVVPYNIAYRPRVKSGGSIIYDISFDFFEVGQ